MPADNDNEDSKYRADRPLTMASIATTRSGMDLPPLRLSGIQHTERSPRSSPAQLPSYRSWDEQRPLSLLSRPRSQTERVELPSIRQAVPEIQMRGNRSDANYRTDPQQQSPTPGPTTVASGPAPEPNIVSLYKRRRLSNDDGDLEQRDMYQARSRSPSRFGQRMYNTTISPSSSTRRPSIASASDSRSGSNRPSPHVQSRGLPAMRSSPSLDQLNSSRQEWRPTLPGLPSLTLDRGPPPIFRGQTVGESHFDTVRSGAHTYPQGTSAYETPSLYSSQVFSNNYHPRGQSMSGPSGRERTPFSANSHHYSNSSNFPYGVDMTDSGNESKQRKRRGNLPKETTDKLRAWFHAHIQHPYPTEDEKQDLMRQTGLQMNQISNWFINARRRQLPAMINNARAESDARSARSGDVSVQLDGIAEYRPHRDIRSSGPQGDSDDGGSSYEDEYSEAQGQKDPRPPLRKRGSF